MGISLEGTLRVPVPPHLWLMGTLNSLFLGVGPGMFWAVSETVLSLSGVTDMADRGLEAVDFFNF